MSVLPFLQKEINEPGYTSQRKLSMCFTKADSSVRIEQQMIYHVNVQILQLHGLMCP